MQDCLYTYIHVKNQGTVKLLFIISVVKNDIVFITEIPCTDDFVLKNLVSDYLPNLTSDHQILHAQSHSPGAWDHSRVHMYLFVGLCKL